MKNFPAYFQKELIENLRTYRLFIILIAFVIFALMEPVIYRMLPRILASEGLDPEVFGMMDTSQQGLLRSYIGNMIQTGILVFTLTLSGALAHEIQKNYWILPRTKGGNASALILSKYMLYSFGIIIVILISFFINRFYTGVLFESTGLTVLWTLQSGLIFSLYFLFILALLFFLRQPDKTKHRSSGNHNVDVVYRHASSFQLSGFAKVFALWSCSGERFVCH